jgi:acetylornithine deacetylase/succinyl-diaminopimelate desuccinylase-like protein
VPRGTLAPEDGRVRGLLIVALTIVAGSAGATQERAAFTGDARVRAALQSVRANERATIADQIRLCEIPAPTFGEGARAAVVRDLLQAAGLKNVRTDREGNVVGERRGRSARPNVVLAAHLDTVFPAATPVKVTRSGPVLRGPGIGDNCRGLAVLVAVARALNAAGVETAGSITFAATVGEEGLGNLRGTKALLSDTLKGRVDRFVALDGTGGAVTNIGVGSRRYRFTFRGPGGHSYNNFRGANPVHALSRAADRISAIQVPSRPKTTFNIGRIGGGSSVNAIPEESWMEVDLRSSDAAALDALDRSVQQIVAEAAVFESARARQNGAISVNADRIGDRPAGRTDERSSIVRTALAISKTVQLTASLTEASTDANAAMQLGIPAIAVGGGGRGTGAHSRAETFDSTNSERGTARALLLAISLSQE